MTIDDVLPTWDVAQRARHAGRRLARARCRRGAGRQRARPAGDRRAHGHPHAATTARVCRSAGPRGDGANRAGQARRRASRGDWWAACSRRGAHAAVIARSPRPRSCGPSPSRAWVRVATAFTATPEGDGCRMRTETRIAAHRRRRRAGAFGRYWRLIGPSASITRREMLAASAQGRGMRGYLGLGSNVGDRRAQPAGRRWTRCRPTASASRALVDLRHRPGRRDPRPAAVPQRLRADRDRAGARGAARRLQGRSSASWAATSRAASATRPRPIDVDLLLLGDERTLRAPDAAPRAGHERRFVLDPAARARLRAGPPTARGSRDCLAALPRRRGRAPRGAATAPAGVRPSDPSRRSMTAPTSARAASWSSAVAT